MSWWWMSFCDSEEPEGFRFLGALLIEADNEYDMLFKSHILKLNPGGEVAFFKVPKELEYRIDKSFTYRLLTQEEAESLDKKWERLQ